MKCYLDCETFIVKIKERSAEGCWREWRDYFERIYGRLQHYDCTQHTVLLLYKYTNTRSLGALRAPTSSWRPFGPLVFVLRARSGRVTHAIMWSLDSVIGTLLIFVDKSKTFHRQIQKISSTNPKNFVDKSKKLR